MLEWIITSCVLIVTVVLVRFLLKGRIGLHLQYGLWLLVLLRLLIPVNFISSPMSVMNVIPESAAFSQSPPVSQITTDIELPEPPLPDLPLNPTTITTQTGNQPSQTLPEQSVPIVQEMPTNKPSLGHLLILVWIAGMAVTAGVFLFANIRFAIQLRRTRKPEEPACPLPVYSTSIIHAPCLFGLFRPAIYLTDQALEDPGRQHILVHELTHFKHLDHIWGLLRCVCLVVHWYNPLVWLAAHLSRTDGELACDQTAIRQLGEDNRLEYGKTLIRLTCTEKDTGVLFTSATTMTGSKKALTHRVRLIARHPKTALYAVICLVLVAAVAVGCTFTGAKEPLANTPGKATSEETTPEEPESAEKQTISKIILQHGYNPAADYMDYSVFFSDSGLLYRFSTHNRLFMEDLNVIISGSELSPISKSAYDQDSEYIDLRICGMNDQDYGDSCLLQINQKDQLHIKIAQKDCYYKSTWLYSDLSWKLEFHTDRADQYYEVLDSSGSYTVYGFDTSAEYNRSGFNLQLTDDYFVYAWGQFGTGTMAQRAKFYHPETGRISPTYLGPSDYYQNMVVSYGTEITDFCTVKICDIFSGEVLYTVDHYEYPINRTMFNAVEQVHFNYDGSAILVQYYDEEYLLHRDTIILPTEIRLNRTVTHRQTETQLPEYSSWTRSGTPWENPKKPSSNIPVGDQQVAAEIAEAVVNGHFTGYQVTSVGFHPVEKVWVIGLTNTDNTQGLMTAIRWEDALILGVWETPAGATYEPGSTPWLDSENLLKEPYVAKKETAGLIAEAIRASWSRQAGVFYPHMCVQSVSYVESHNYWFIFLGPHVHYPSSEEIYLVIDGSDGHIVNIWY